MEVSVFTVIRSTWKERNNRLFIERKATLENKKNVGKWASTCADFKNASLSDILFN